MNRSKKVKIEKHSDNLMQELNEPVPESTIVHELQEALDFAEQIGFPIIVRPAYTLGGTGGGIADSMEEFDKLSIRWIKGKSNSPMFN